MKEKIIIENFLGLKQINIEVGDINILIGKQATGKSVIAKLLYYFKSFFKDIISTAHWKKTIKDFEYSHINKFYEYFPPNSWGNGTFFLEYSRDNKYIRVERKRKNNTDLQLKYHDCIKSIFNRFKEFQSQSTTKKQYNDLIQPDWPLINYATEQIESEFGVNSATEQFFIPAGRTFFSNFRSIIFTLLTKNVEFDPFLKYFGSLYENTKNLLISNQIKYTYEYPRQNITELFRKILCGEHKIIDGEDYIKSQNGRLTSILNASSGQQEILPLSIILSTLPFMDFEYASKTIYIEEPEAHLFPASQRYIIELIANVYNASKDHIQFVITTHSPYVLTSVNNLLQAGQIFRNNKEKVKKELNSIIPEDCYLYADQIKAYSLENGKITDIFSRETGLIDTNIIDAVSDELAIEFDKLLDLE